VGKSKDGDIDIPVELSGPVGFFKFLELDRRLGEWSGRRVDLVTKPALKPHMGRRILSEVVIL
jgi:predicted nucleotidyltransferase